MFKPLIVLFVGLYLNGVISYNPLLTYTVRFKKFTMQPNVTGNYTIDQFRDKQFINGYFSFNYNEAVDTVIAIFYRCNPEGFDCEYWQTWKLTDICPKIIQKNQVWSSWYSSFHPPMVCPLNKVHYKLINGTFDIGPLLVLYPECTNYQWKLIQKLYAGDVYLGGYSMELEFFGYRKRTKSIGKI